MAMQLPTTSSLLSTRRHASLLVSDICASWESVSSASCVQAESFAMATGLSLAAGEQWCTVQEGSVQLDTGSANSAVSENVTQQTIFLRFFFYILKYGTGERSRVGPVAMPTWTRVHAHTHTPAQFVATRVCRSVLHVNKEDKNVLIVWLCSLFKCKVPQSCISPRINTKYSI